MPKLSTIVAGVDFSETSHRAVSWAAHHFAPEAEFILVHALDLPVPPSFLGESPDQHAIAEEMRRASEEDLERLVGEIDGDRFRVEVALGDAPGALGDNADRAGADLILVGAHGERGGVGGLLGSTAERTLARSATPVLLATGVLDRPPRRILVAIDESESRHEILSWAVFLSERFGAEVSGFHCLDGRLFGRMRLVSSSGRSEDMTRDAESEAQTWLKKELASVGLSAEDEDVVVAVGDPGQAIADQAANGWDLVIIGSRREGTTQRIILGSVAKRVIRITAVPVLMVPEAQ